MDARRLFWCAVLIAAGLTSQLVPSCFCAHVADSNTTEIDPDKHAYGISYGASQEAIIEKFGQPSGTIMLEQNRKGLLYGPSHLLILTDNEFTGLRISEHLLGSGIRGDVSKHSILDSVEWVLVPGIIAGMSPEEVEEVLNMRMEGLNYKRWYTTDRARVILDFYYAKRNGKKVYKLNGLSIDDRAGLPPPEDGPLSLVDSVGGFSNSGDIVYWFGIRASQLRACRDWLPNQELPFSIKDAVEIAGKEAPKYCKSIQDWYLSMITIYNEPELQKWYYVISYLRTMRPRSGVLGCIRIPVLFDGMSVTGRPYTRVEVDKGVERKEVSRDLTEMDKIAKERFGGKVFCFRINGKLLETCPSWSPGEKLPLSVKQAVRLAGSELPKYHKNPDSFQLDRIDIKRLWRSDKWLFVITYSIGSPGPDASLGIRVLMNGQPVEAQVEQDEE